MGSAASCAGIAARDVSAGANHSGSFSILENVGEDEARKLVARDPFVANGVFVLEDVRAWNVYVDELAPSS